MVSKAQAMLLRHGAELHFTGRHDCGRRVGPRGGITESVTRVRVSGSCQTWKTRPDAFRLPVKYGLYESGEITDRNAAEWHVPDDCPLRQADLAAEEAAARALAALEALQEAPGETR